MYVRAHHVSTKCKLYLTSPSSDLIITASLMDDKKSVQAEGQRRCWCEWAVMLHLPHKFSRTDLLNWVQVGCCLHCICHSYFLHPFFCLYKSLSSTHHFWKVGQSRLQWLSAHQPLLYQWSTFISPGNFFFPAWSFLHFSSSLTVFSVSL